MVRLFVECMPKRSHKLRVLALGVEFGALASIIALNKTLVQRKRLGLKKVLDGEDGEWYDERVCRLSPSMMVRYDNKMLIPMMMSPAARESMWCEGSVGLDVKVEIEEREEELFAEAIEPSKALKNCQQLQKEIRMLRSFRKSIAKSASSAASPQWWESTAVLFPNIAVLFRKVVSVPSSH